eukprot:scaffold23831_cov30-Tisochrysis_lutea.AAC.1
MAAVDGCEEVGRHCKQHHKTAPSSSPPRGRGTMPQGAHEDVIGRPTTKRHQQEENFNSVCICLDASQALPLQL